MLRFLAVNAKGKYYTMDYMVSICLGLFTGDKQDLVEITLRRPKITERFILLEDSPNFYSIIDKVQFNPNHKRCLDVTKLFQKI